MSRLATAGRVPGHGVARVTWTHIRLTHHVKSLVIRSECLNLSRNSISKTKISKLIKVSLQMRPLLSLNVSINRKEDISHANKMLPVMIECWGYLYLGLNNAPQFLTHVPGQIQTSNYNDLHVIDFKLSRSTISIRPFPARARCLLTFHGAVQTWRRGGRRASRTRRAPAHGMAGAGGLVSPSQSPVPVPSLVQSKQAKPAKASPSSPVSKLGSVTLEGSLRRQSLEQGELPCQRRESAVPCRVVYFARRWGAERMDFPRVTVSRSYVSSALHKSHRMSEEMTRFSLF